MPRTEAKVMSGFLTGIGFATLLAETLAASRNFRCYSTKVLTGGTCSLAAACDSSAIAFEDDTIQLSGSGCMVTLEDIHQQLPDSVTKSDTVYTLNYPLHITNDCILEIHGPETATEGAAVTLLRLKVSS